MFTLCWLKFSLKTKNGKLTGYLAHLSSLAGFLCALNLTCCLGGWGQVTFGDCKMRVGRRGLLLSGISGKQKFGDRSLGGGGGGGQS